MLFELAHPVKFVGDFEDFGPTHEFSEHGCTLMEERKMKISLLEKKVMKCGIALCEGWGPYDDDDDDIPEEWTD